MNWPILRRRPLPPFAQSKDCAEVRPLLSLMMDDMASPKEVRAAEAHLALCDECRQARLWMEATRQAIVARPAVLPPADMRARIALAIAASAETALPAVPVGVPAALVVAPAPRHRFRVRPVYAAAASVAVAGAFVAHTLLSSHAPATITPITKPAQVATTTTSAQTKGSAPVDNTLPTPTHPIRRQPARVANLLPAPRTDTTPDVPSFMSVLTAQVARTTVNASALPNSAQKSAPAQVATVPRTTAVPKAPAPHPADNQIASRLPSKSSVPARVIPSEPKMATVPQSAATNAVVPSPPLVTPPPSTAPASQQVAVRTPDTASVPAVVVPGNALGSVRVFLASSRTTGYARRLSMANGVHLRPVYVQGPIAYTPTSLDTPTVPRRTAAMTPPPTTAAQASYAPSETRRSEGTKQVADASVSGGA